MTETHTVIAVAKPNRADRLARLSSLRLRQRTSFKVTQLAILPPRPARTAAAAVIRIDGFHGDLQVKGSALLASRCRRVELLKILDVRFSGSLKTLFVMFFDPKTTPPARSGGWCFSP
jgi:hypothetical protein